MAKGFQQTPAPRLTKTAILTLDLGSSSTRAALYGSDSKPLKHLTARGDWRFIPTLDGGSQMDARDGFEIVRNVLDELLTKARGRGIEITHVAICSFWHSLMGVNGRGHPTTPVLGWADTRSGRYSAELKKRFDERVVHDRTGAHFHSSFWPAKLLWLRREHRDVFARTAHWMAFCDYVVMRLTGQLSTSISMASGSGVFDQRRCAWDNELLKYVKVKESHLPELARPDVGRKLNSKFKRLWPELSKAKLLLPIGDGAADHVGSCGIRKGRASLMVGTSAAMRIAWAAEPPNNIPQGLWCYRIDEKRVIVGGALSDGGNLYEWCRRNLRLPPNVEDEIQKRDLRRPLPTVLPFFHGERSTGYREDARGAILDLTASHDGIEILHAVMVGVARQLADVHQRLEDIAPVKQIVASGGALRGSPLWREIISKMLGRKLHLGEARECALQGLADLTLNIWQGNG